MTTPVANIGFHCTITVNDGPSNAQVAFNSAAMVSFPDPECGTTETTPLAMSTPVRKFIPTLTDPGSWNFEIFYNKTDYERLVALRGVEKVYVIGAPPDSAAASLSISVPAILLKHPVEVEVDQPMKVKCELKATDVATLT